MDNAAASSLKAILKVADDAGYDVSEVVLGDSKIELRKRLTPAEAAERADPRSRAPLRLPTTPEQLARAARDAEVMS